MKVQNVRRYKVYGHFSFMCITLKKIFGLMCIKPLLDQGICDVVQESKLWYDVM
jgi:hypothetical protein